MDPQRAQEVALGFLSAGTHGPDPLASPADLLDWLEGAGLPVPSSLRASPPDASRLHREASLLRETGRSALTARSEGRPLPSEALYALGRVLDSSRVARRLEVVGAGLRLVEVETETELLSTLAPLALGLAQLVTSADPRRLRRCGAPDCRAWFLDASKSGRRKWCSMARCGNRAKAARHRRRQATGRSRG